MLHKELLKRYKSDVENIRENSKKVGLCEKEIDAIFKQCFDELESKYNKNGFLKPQDRTSHKRIWICLLLFIFLFFIYILLNVHQPTTSIVLRNVQGLTYPALKFVRIVSTPFIKLFPTLTDLYDETCLLENPYFYVSDMECWPCKDIHSVINMTDKINVIKSELGGPFIIKTNQPLIEFSVLQNLYTAHKDVLDQESQRIKSSISEIKSLQDLFQFDMNRSSTVHIQWRINKMMPAQVIRKLFPRPYFLPERSGQSVERFLMIDQVKAEPYVLPNTECSYVFIVQGSGERTIVLKPSKECSKHCRSVSVVLKPSYVLWYNWWYWRPISLPCENSTTLSISYINSYC